MDPTEGNQTAENAGSFVGQTYGSSGAPLSGKITTVTTIDNGGTAGALDMNNNLVNDQFSTTSGGTTTTFTFDATAVFNATLTYADGTTATVSAVISQDTAGNLYLAPDPAAGMDEAAYEAKPITSVTLNSVAGDTYSGMSSNRFSTGFDDGYIDGTAGGDLINGSYVEAVSSGSDKTITSAPDRAMTASIPTRAMIRPLAATATIWPMGASTTIPCWAMQAMTRSTAMPETIICLAAREMIYSMAGWEMTPCRAALMPISCMATRAMTA